MSTVPPEADADRKREAGAEVPDIDMDLLQPMLREFVGAIGLAKTLLVVQRCGGARIYFPRKPGPAHWLSELIGQDDARKLGTMYGSETMVVPKALATLRALRNRRFIALRDSTSLNQAARTVGLTRRGAQMVLAKERDRRIAAGTDPPGVASARPAGSGSDGLKPRVGSRRAACRRSGRSARAR